MMTVRGKAAIVGSAKAASARIHSRGHVGISQASHHAGCDFRFRPSASPEMRRPLKLLALIADRAEMFVDPEHDQHELG